MHVSADEESPGPHFRSPFVFSSRSAPCVHRDADFVGRWPAHPVPTSKARFARDTFSVGEVQNYVVDFSGPRWR